MSIAYFAPCPRGLEQALADELAEIAIRPEVDELAAFEVGRTVPGGVHFFGTQGAAYAVNLHSRIASRVLMRLGARGYRSEDDIYTLAAAQRWEDYFTPDEMIRVDVTAHKSPLQSLKFVGLRVKDGVCDRFRQRMGARPSVDTVSPDVRIYAYLTETDCTIYLDTTGEPLFKRGWREDKGDAPLKETLAAAMLAASGWADGDADLQPLYDPCCGSGTIAIEAAQIACNIAAGSLRRFAFEKFVPFRQQVWSDMKKQAAEAVVKPEPGQPALIYGSDVSHRMVDFAQRNAQRAGVADVIEFRGGDALQRLPPIEGGGVMLMNPPYGERIGIGGVAGEGDQARFGARELAETEDGVAFFTQLASHWKKNYAGWTAWVLTPDLKLPAKMRLKESRRVPMWNGPIECRLFKFDMVKGSARTK